MSEAKQGFRILDTGYWIQDSESNPVCPLFIKPSRSDGASLAVGDVRSTNPRSKYESVGSPVGAAEGFTEDTNVLIKNQAKSFVADATPESLIISRLATDHLHPRDKPWGVTFQEASISSTR